jgi:16S rRNA (guanine966-N2)-methyltransferase
MAAAKRRPHHDPISPPVPPSAANRVRIIGGAWRGRIVRFPPMANLRPTPDRVRETLFNWLGQDLTARRCLDLYAGTGVLALEAASRGAALAVAVDRSRTLIGALRATGQAFGATALETHCGEARAFLARERREFDVIFLDPPYRDDPWDWLLPACAARLAPGGFVYAEAARVLEPPPALALWRRDKAGQVHYHLFARAAGPAE